MSQLHDMALKAGAVYWHEQGAESPVYVLSRDGLKALLEAQRNGCASLCRTAAQQWPGVNTGANRCADLIEAIGIE